MSPNHPVGPDLHPYATKSICLVSQWPSFFGAFEKWLTALYSESVSGLALSIPIERLVLFFLKPLTRTGDTPVIGREPWLSYNNLLTPQTVERLVLSIERYWIKLNFF